MADEFEIVDASYPREWAEEREFSTLPDISPSADYFEQVGATLPASGGEDPNSKTLAPQALSAYRAANERYKQTAGAKYDFILLSEARRSASYQSEFYERYLWRLNHGGPPAPAANRPGTSKHEYGYAIDVRLGGDVNRIKSALNAEGWIDDKQNEPWHFEARNTPSFPQVQSYIETEKVQSAANKFAEKLDNILSKKRRYLQAKPDFDRRRDQLNKTKDALSREKASLSRRRHDLAKTAGHLRNERSEINAEQRAVAALGSKIARMKYDRCPNQNPFDDCDHEDLKAAWLREKRQLEYEYKQRKDLLDRRKTSFEEAYVAYQKDLAALELDIGFYEKKVTDFERASEEFDRDYVEIVKIIDDLDAWESEKVNLIGEIQSVIEGAPT